MERIAPGLVALSSAGTALKGLLCILHAAHTELYKIDLNFRASEKETHGVYQKHSNDTSSSAVPMRQKTF